MQLYCPLRYRVECNSWYVAGTGRASGFCRVCAARCRTPRPRCYGRPRDPTGRRPPTCGQPGSCCSPCWPAVSTPISVAAPSPCRPLRVAVRLFGILAVGVFADPKVMVPKLRVAAHAPTGGNFVVVGEQFRLLSFGVHCLVLTTCAVCPKSCRGSARARRTRVTRRGARGWRWAGRRRAARGASFARRHCPCCGARWPPTPRAARPCPACWSCPGRASPPVSAVPQARSPQPDARRAAVSGTR